MDIVVHQSMTSFDANQWNSLLPSNNPFMRHEFLLGLEQSNCVCERLGWQNAHIAIYSSEAENTSTKGRLIGAMPCYIKGHSYGEYIFDWSWADAHHRHGLEYYPKLSNAVPFTPATGERLLISAQHDRQILEKALIDKAIELCETQNLSSFHSLFIEQQQADALKNLGCLTRHSSQFHWQNKEYKTFDDFLSLLSSL